MNCPHCSVEVASSAKFCPECGAPLSLTSPSSPTESDHTTLLQKYIPPELAKRIISAGKQIESERRLVTVLFADVSGFTAMSEKLDAEEVSTVLNDCFKGLISIVYKYEGVIDKFIGDEIMAIFGAPLTHENDPERAVRCSMEMMEYMERFNQLSPVTLPEPLGLHISMNTGMVVAGNVGSDLRMNYSVIGDTVNLASRLKHIAERGQIALSEGTYRIVSSLVNAEEPRLVDIKGKSEPAKVYKILSLKGGIEPGTRVTQKSPIIGRDQEIAQLKNAIGQVQQKKEQRLFIRGEAGVGKTRLKLELIQHAKSSGITVYEGKCSSFEINTPYYLWTTLVKDILQLKADTVESETRKRLHDMLQILSMEKHEPYLATLLSLRYEEILLEEDLERKKRIFESLKEFIRALAGRKPSLFLLEDVHWIDRFSQDLLNYLFTEKQLAPAMFVPLFRDEYVHSKELIEKGGTLIDLNRLTPADAKRLMCARLQTEDVPSNLADLIYKRSEGNPFFIEELVKTLLDKNVVAVKKQKLEILKTDFENILPETVQGVIMARIDRLEERLKEVLYGASVIGREFNKQLLKELLRQTQTVDPSLKDLVSLELVLEKEEAKEFTYLFKHYLIQEVAYNTILQKKRKELHALIARAIESLYADKLKEFYELLAFHYERAEEWEKAADYLSRAGRKVGEIYSKDESNAFVGRKEAAIQKLYEAASEKRLGWIVLGVVMAVIVLPFAAAMLFMPFFIGYMVWNIPSYIEASLFGSEILGTIFFYLYAVILFFAYPWIGLLFTYFGIVPAFKGRPKLFDIMDDSVRVLLKKSNLVTIPFSEIQDVMFFDPKLKKTRPLSRKILDPFCRLAGDSKFTFGVWFREVATDILPPYSFAFGSKEGEIQIRRKKGANRRRLLMPWLNSAKRARVVSISPSNPREFFDQLQVALTKWKKETKNDQLRSIAHHGKRRLRFSAYHFLILFVAVIAFMVARHMIRPFDFYHLPPESFGNPDSVIAELIPALNKGTADPKVFLECGKAYLLKGTMMQRRDIWRSWGAEEICEKSSDLLLRGIELDSNSVQLLYYYGLSMLSQFSYTPYQAQFSYAPYQGGLLFVERSRYTEAITALERARQLDPKNEKVLTELGHAYLVQSNLLWGDEPMILEHYTPNAWVGRAQEALQTALQLNPESEKEHRYLGDVYFVQGRYRKAFQEYDQALTYGSSDPEEYRLLVLRYIGSGAYAWADPALRAMKESKIAEGTLIASALLPMAVLGEPGLYGIATNLVGLAVDLDSTDAKAVKTLMFYQLKSGRQEEAVRNYFRLRRIDPGSAFNVISSSGENLPLAQDLMPGLLKAAIRSDPRNYFPYMDLGSYYGMIAMPLQPDSAIAQFQKAIELNPHVGAPYCALGETYLQRRDTAKALELIQSAFATRDTVVIRDIFDSYVKLKRIDDATQLANTQLRNPRTKSYAYATIADYYLGDRRQSES